MSECPTCHQTVPDGASLILVQKLGGGAIHVGHRSRHLGNVVSTCNGRTMPGFEFHGSAADITCKRCKANQR